MGTRNNNWPGVRATILMSIVMQATMGATPDLEPGVRFDSPPEELADQVLDPVLVGGLRPIRDRQVLLDWLTRLPGKFKVSGAVQLHRADNDRTLNAEGSAVCVGIVATLAPAVQCELDVAWPSYPDGGLPSDVGSSLKPAVFMFGYAFDQEHSIRHLLVDNHGKAEGASGNLISPDTLLSRAKCLTTPAPCERVVRVTAGPDLSVVKIDVDIEVGQLTVLTQRLIMQRQL